jgi:hypothetical protein
VIDLVAIVAGDAVARQRVANAQSEISQGFEVVEGQVCP